MKEFTLKLYLSDDGQLFTNQQEACEHEYEVFGDPMDSIVQKYLDDENTVVHIDHNDETGKWLYSVVVNDSGAFWLDSFDTLKKARSYITEHNLTHDLQGDIL